MSIFYIYTENTLILYNNNRGDIIKGNPLFIKKIHEISLDIDQKFYDPSIDIQENLAHIMGDWTNSLEIDSKQYWNISEDLVYPLNEERYPLPSDSKFRLDCLYLKLKDEGLAQEAKDELEKIQRNDQKLRENKKSNNIKMAHE